MRLEGRENKQRNTFSMSDREVREREWERDGRQRDRHRKVFVKESKRETERKREETDQDKQVKR